RLAAPDRDRNKSSTPSIDFAKVVLGPHLPPRIQQVWQILRKNREPHLAERHDLWLQLHTERCRPLQTGLKTERCHLREYENVKQPFLLKLRHQHRSIFRTGEYAC